MPPKNAVSTEPRPVDVARNGRRPLIVWGAVLAACITTIAWIASAPELKVPVLPSAPAAITPATSVQERAEFYDISVTPAVAAADTANRAAAARCLERIAGSFDKYRAGIGPFTKDLTSLSTRFGVMRRMPSDWWYKQDEISAYVGEKFETHLFSNAKLGQDIEGASASFRAEVHANQNEMLTEIRAAVEQSDLPQLPSVDYKDFSAEVTATLKSHATAAATDSVIKGLLTELASGVGGAAATQLTAAVAVRLGATVAASSAAAGGATAGGAAAGGAGGTTLGPAGTAVGAGVGLVVGVLVDWWMTAQFESSMTAQLTELIDSMERTVVEGDTQQPGLRISLVEVCNKIRDAYTSSLYAHLVEGSP
jgi:hypothetical protein